MILNIYIFVVGLSFLISLLSFKWNYPFQLKIFSLLLGLTFLVELFAAIIVIKYFHWKNNFPIYNSFILIEILTYAFFYYNIMQIVWMRKLIASLAFVFFLFWVVSVFFIHGFNAWNSYVIISGGSFTVCVSLGYYYQIIQSKTEINLLSHPEFWIATGMLIFYSCQVPYFGTLNFLIKNYLPLAYSLMNVLLVINTFMYLTFIYAFLCPRIQRKYS